MVIADGGTPISKITNRTLVKSPGCIEKDTILTRIINIAQIQVHFNISGSKVGTTKSLRIICVRV
jgi:hypothetical protein